MEEFWFMMSLMFTLLVSLVVGTIGVELIKAPPFGQAIERFNKRMEVKNAALREENIRLHKELRRKFER